MRMKGKRGWRPFFPDLEPKRKTFWCSTCGNVRAQHWSTKRHRDRTRPREYDRGSGDWLRPRHQWRDKTDADYEQESQDLQEAKR